MPFEEFQYPDYNPEDNDSYGSSAEEESDEEEEAA